jgi:hypothetical protein
MHKYSAILAATEPIRLQTQAEVKKSLSPMQYISYCWNGIVEVSLMSICVLFVRFVGNLISRQFSTTRNINKAVDVACSKYEFKVEDTLR